MGKIELMPFQRECLREVEWFGGRCLIAMEMGTGKTLVALEHLRRHPESLPAVVICPASVKYHWEREALRIGFRRPLVLEGRNTSGTDGSPLVPVLAIVNYDVLRDWLPVLKRWRPKTVVLDECHYLQSGRTRRTKAATELCKGIPGVLALSGTPLLNRPIELYPVLHLLRPKVWSSRWWFVQKYCNPRWTPWGWNYKGATNADELHESLSREVMVRRLKSDVLSELPPKLREVIPVPTSDPDEYRRADLDFAAWLHRQDPAKAKRSLKAEAMVKVGYLLRLAARLKLPAAVEWINDFLDGGDEKLVVFARHRAMIDGLRQGCRAKSVTVDGAVTGRKRAAMVDAFQTDSGVRLLLGNIQAAGVGITLTAACHVAFAEMAWRPGDHTQAEDRCHRIGTTRTVWSHYLVARGTVEEKLCGIVQQKQETLSAVLDGGRVEGDLDVLDLLLKEM